MTGVGPQHTPAMRIWSSLAAVPKEARQVRRLKGQRGRPKYGLWNRTGSNSRGSVRHVFLGSNLPAV